jgi:GNAT superfamily N-acetyltransferase
MKIKEYDEVDSWDVLHLNLMCLGYALTPERASLIRMLDRRPFPFLAIYAVEGGTVCGQVGVFRLPMITREGREDIGGIWAVCTHPSFSRHGIASQLLEEAHARMREAGLRFSTLGTNRYRVAHRLYASQGYKDFICPSSAFARAEIVDQKTNLRADHAHKEDLHLADEIFRCISLGMLGFSVRHESFLSMMVEIGDVDLKTVFLLRHERELVGYALARNYDDVLRVTDLLLAKGYEPSHAVSALARESGAAFFHITLYNQSTLTALQDAGYSLARGDWATFMIAPLTDDITIEEAKTLFGVHSGRFLVSWMDMT